MDSVLRGLAVYLFLLIVFRVAGRRTLAETSNFDLVLLLIISETIQQAMIDQDHSITNGFLLIITLVGTNIALAWLKDKSPPLDRWLEDLPVLLIKNGEMLKERMHKEWVSEEEIMTAARRLQGLERLDQIKYAVLEPGGEITIIPQPPKGGS